VAPLDAICRLFAFRVIVMFGPGTSVTSSVAPLSEVTTCPVAIFSRVTAPAASMALVTPPFAMPRVRSPFEPPPVRPGPAMIERIVPNRKAISYPVPATPAIFEISDPASTMRPLPSANVASTLPWTIVAGTSDPRPIRRCS